MEGFKLLITFILVLVLLWQRVPLSPVMLGASALLAVLYHSGPWNFLMMIWRAVTNYATIELAMILVSIMILEHLLREHGYLKRMLTALQVIIRNPRVVIPFLPAFIGLMPSVGGALFSAPLVEQAASGTSISSEQKSFVNFYYRHTSEYFLPIYPSVLFASRVSGVPLLRLVAAMAPFGLLVILLGIPMLLKLPVKKEQRDVLFDHMKTGRELFISALPVLVVVFLVLVLRVEVGLAVGMVLVPLLFYHRYTPSKFWGLCREAISLKTIIMVFAVMIFKQVLEDTSAVEGLPVLLAKLPVPGFVIFTIVNFFVGMMTGIMVACVGIGFPIAMAGMGMDFTLMTAVLLFIAGFTGTMLTPMHLCLTLTVDFFKVDLKKVQLMLIGPEAALLLITLIAYLIIKYFLH